jgi:hypothetical protein
MGRFFLFLVLDEVICPYLVKQFDMSTWHPTDEIMLDALMNAEVDTYAIFLVPKFWLVIESAFVFSYPDCLRRAA